MGAAVETKPTKRATRKRKPKTTLGEYVYDREAAEQPVNFVQDCIRMSDGRRVELIDWQADVLRQLFGWRHKKTGRLRYRRGFLGVAKKAGKSWLMSCLTAYISICVKPAQDVYLAAVDREQARIIYRGLVSMVRSSPILERALEIVESKSLIRNKRTGCVIRCLSSEAHRQQGLNGSVIIDEICFHKSAELVDSLAYATRATPNGLVFSISTAGFDVNGPGRIAWDTAVAVQESGDGHVNPTFFGRVYAADPKDDISKPSTWRKANPSIGHTFPESEFRSDYEDAITDPRKLTSWMRYSLNLWTTSETRWFAPGAWADCKLPLEIPDGYGSCYMGLDLSSNLDLTSMCCVWPNPSGDGTYSAKWLFWIPEETIKDRSQHTIPYDTWVREGWIKPTQGARLDHSVVAQDIIDFASNYACHGVAVDPWQAGMVITLLQSAGLNVQTVSQRTSHLNSACRFLEGLVAERKLRHGGNPVAAWMANHVAVFEDSTGMIKPDKARSKEKIDGIAALVNAMAIAEVAESTDWNISIL